MSYYFDTHYLCGDKKFHNIFQAFDEQKRSGCFPEFVVDHELITRLGKLERPADCSRSRLQKLMVGRLKELRTRYNKLKVAFGGGTDSYTIVKLCVDNDIYIDETITLLASQYGNVRTNIEPWAGLKSIRKFLGRHIGKITEVYPAPHEIEYANDPYWFLKLENCRGPNLQHRYQCFGETIAKSMANQTDSIMLTGHEKPYLRSQGGRLYWYVSDSGVGMVSGIENTIPFFIDKENPELVTTLAYAYLDAHTSKHKIKEGDYITYDTSQNRDKNQILEQIGFHRTPYNFVNWSLMGKAQYNLTRKDLRFHKECNNLGKSYIVKNILNTHQRIKKLYGNLPHALETNGELVKPVGRISQQIEMNG